MLPFTQYLGLPELPHGEEVTHIPGWLIHALSFDPTLLPPVLTESTVPNWLYWTLTLLHAVPGIVVGLLAGWFVMRPVNAILSWLLGGFNRGFDGLTAIYAWVIGLAAAPSCPGLLLVYLGLVGLTCAGRSCRGPPPASSPKWIRLG